MKVQIHHPDVIARHGGLFVFFGILLAAIGAVALFKTFAATIVSVFILGVLLSVAGLSEAFITLRAEEAGGVALHLLSACLYAIAGVYMISNPLSGALTLTFVLAAVYFALGIVKIAASISVKDYSNKSGWLAFNGIVDVALGLLIASQWPVSGFWAIGLFVGIDCIVHGVTWIAIGLSRPEYALTGEEEEEERDLVESR